MTTNPPPADADLMGLADELAELVRAQAVLDYAADGDPSLAAHRALKAINDVFRTPSPLEAVVQRVARAMADQLRRDTADYPNTAIDTRVCPQEGMWGAEVDGEIDLMSLARAALQQVQTVDGLERVREALEAALCAPDWSASLGHVHEAIRQLNVRPETEG